MASKTSEFENSKLSNSDLNRSLPDMSDSQNSKLTTLSSRSKGSFKMKMTSHGDEKMEEAMTSHGDDKMEEAMTSHGDDKMEEDSGSMRLFGEFLEIGDEQMHTENKDQSLNNHDPVNRVWESRLNIGTAINLPAKIFSKSLSQSDINSRLSVPQSCLHFFPVPEESGKIQFEAIDTLGKPWSFILSSRRGESYCKPVISGGWSAFVREKGVKMGDILTIFMESDGVDGVRYSIKVSRKIFNVLANLQ